MKTKTIIEKRKSLTLKVEGDTLVIKRPPHLSDEVVNNFINKKKKWIEAQFKLNQKFMISFDQPLILFNEPVNLYFENSKTSNIVKTNEFWIVYDQSEQKALKSVNKLLTVLLINKIEERLNTLQKLKSFKYREIKIKNLKSSWGNCKSNQQLTFAFRLVHMDENFVNSVIAHEVSHLFVMNHSDSFYRVLSQFDPNYHSSIKGQWDR